MASPLGDDHLMCPSICAVRAGAQAWNFLHPCSGSELGFFVASASAFWRCVVGRIPAHLNSLCGNFVLLGSTGNAQTFAPGSRAYKTRVDETDHPQSTGPIHTCLSITLRRLSTVFKLSSTGWSESQYWPRPLPLSLQHPLLSGNRFTILWVIFPLTIRVIG